MLRKHTLATAIGVSLALGGCAANISHHNDRSGAAEHAPASAAQPERKAVVYQMFTRLFGNTNQTNQPWGSLEENGVGKFADINDAALQGIKQLGVSHVWYTGVLHHATATDYRAHGISNDDPDVIKGRAGSPYAVKDYYSVNPDLAQDPAQRMAEFKALVERTHRHGMKVLIDIVPNHIARDYRSLGKPEGVRDFGADDDTSVAYARDNNFYYVPGQAFQLPDWQDGYQPLGGEANPLVDGQFAESPAKWTGNGARAAKPGFHDWYETIKVNYGIRPDGSKDFPLLPADYANRPIEDHYAFWQGKSVPSSWLKFRDIALFWTAFGIDGFRYDMAEMVPVEFWSFMNSAIKQANPDAFLLAEVYNPKEYRNYINLGRMDYLYDKVELYDTLKGIIQDKQSTDEIAPIQAGLADIEQHMLHFLENHDEQRIASADFAGKAENALPAMVLSATISTAPTMLYFGQEVGEPGAGDAGFGQATRTTIFDYWGVPHHQRWMNNGKFDGGQLSDAERQLRDYYVTLMRFSASSPALLGQYQSLHQANKNSDGYHSKLFSFARWSEQQQLLIVNNFSQNQGSQLALTVPAALISQWQLSDGRYSVIDRLSGLKNQLIVRNGIGTINSYVAPLQSQIWQRQ
ncbi:alpha-amylase family protein [uncultured Ferrimonas sp.]|uniref:alpha-amylase family protein n=1 Tax=uncultured Ferrimonas sp. TaxID=432640 RepID=UPI002603BB33|nr:alpha-amylase family protein [uncultured Ferrimonas sp.]